MTKEETLELPPVQELMKILSFQSTWSVWSTDWMASIQSPLWWRLQSGSNSLQIFISS